MMSGSPHRSARILLLAALWLPGWAILHALVHEHLAEHHGHAAAAGTEVHIEHGGQAAHEHSEEVIRLLPSRGKDEAPLAVLPAASALRVAAEQSVRSVRERAPTRRRAELALPSHPRAPPHA
jgi:hypothetical protein